MLCSAVVYCSVSPLLPLVRAAHTTTADMVSVLGPPAPPTREGEVMTISRVTRDGRRLHYDLQVLQQPERARACGSGPKCETSQ